MIFESLRDFLDKCEEVGELKIVEGADWDLEIGIITELASYHDDSPLLLFDKIKGYKAGYRVASNMFLTPKRTALGLGLPLEARGMELVKAWREKIRGGVKLVPPVEVKTGPVKENVHMGEDIDLFEFPAPKWHELDGGRFLGTGHCVITRDPDEEWVNVGTYRMQIHDKQIATIDCSPGRHCEMIAKKYWKKGLPCPVAVTCGQDPMLWGVSSFGIPWGVSEYDYVGGLRDKPIEVIRGEVTGLPIPATAEIAIEGDWMPPEVELIDEGPFGEWDGHYGKGIHAGKATVFRVKSIYHRDDPIIHGAPPLIRCAGWTCGMHIRRAGTLWDDLDRQVPGVKGVWIVEEAGPYWAVVISIKQQYPGHAKQAALTAAGTMSAGYLLKYVVVVDDDIDPSNTSEGLWAVCAMADPAESIDIVRGCWGSLADPYLSPEKKARKDFTHGTAIILAVKPYHWIEDFPLSIRTSPELLKKTNEKWGSLFEKVA